MPGVADRPSSVDKWGLSVCRRVSPVWSSRAGEIGCGKCAGKHRYEFNPQKLQGFCFNKKGSCRDGFLWFVSSRLEFILVGRHIIFVAPTASREGGVRMFYLWRTSVLSEPFFRKHPVKSLHPLRKLRKLLVMLTRLDSALQKLQAVISPYRISKFLFDEHCHL